MSTRAFVCSRVFSSSDRHRETLLADLERLRAETYAGLSGTIEIKGLFIRLGYLFYFG